METKKLIILAVALVVVTFGGYFLFQANQGLLEYANREYAEMQEERRQEQQGDMSDQQQEGSVRWVYGENGWWQPEGELLKDCPDTPVFDAPVDLSLATGVLYPGQWRGDRSMPDNFKPHGGFRFDGLDVDEVTVRMPADAQLVQMAQYLAQGEVQYTLEFITQCGFVMRLGHLRELAPRLAVIAETLPPAAEGDSRTHFVGPVQLEQGEVVATATGLRGLGASPGRHNTFVDWGVYRTDRKNAASADVTWAKEHTTPQEQYAVCWFDYLSEEDESLVRSLSAGSEGPVSNFCGE